MKTTSLVSAMIVAAALCLSACGGDDPQPPVPPAGVGASGGTVSGPGGASVVVPANALNANVVIEVTQSGAGAPALPTNVIAAGALYTVTPHGQSFQQPVAVTVPFDAAQVPSGARLTLFKTTNGVSGPWTEVPGATLSGNALVGNVTAFSVFVVGFLPQITQQPQSVTVSEGQSATFSVTAIGFSPPFTYQWQRSNDGGTTFVDIPTATGATYGTGVTVAASDNDARFRVIVANSSGNVQSNAATLTVTSAATMTLSVTTSGNGTVASSPSGIDCGADCSESYLSGTQVTLTATPAQGATFTAWSGDADCSDGTVTMNAARACTATFASAPAPVVGTQIAAGNGFSLAVNAGGTVYSWGGIVSNGAPNANSSIATPVTTISNVRSISAGASGAAVAVKTDGTVWAWGYRGSIDCQFGQEANVPYQIQGASSVQAASIGIDHTLLLKSDGTVSAFGCNVYGQLGRTGTAPAVTAVPVVGLSSIVAVAAGNGYSLAVDSNGQVWSWGRAVPGDFMSPSVATPTVVAGLSGIRAVAAGLRHALALRQDGAVWAWGDNTNGKLGDGTSISRAAPVATLLGAGITAIAADDQFSLALRNDGVVLSWGINETGQLGSGSSSPGFREQPGPVISLTGVTAIAAGGPLGHSLALKNDGTVWAWGYNDVGQLGNGNRTFSTTPVQVTGLNLQ